MKIYLIILLLLVPIAFAQTELTDPGILPDSPFYFVDQLFERAGDNPEKALEYRQEKIAEAHAMAEKKKAEYAKQALDKASEYSSIIEDEATPELENDLEKTASAVEQVLTKISDELPELADEIEEQKKQEKRALLAAKVSSKIKKLCETLSELDPTEYEKVCRSDDAPQWQKELDEKLTDEQSTHAKVFVDKMEQCMSSKGKTCDCEGLGIQSFVAVCKEQSALAARCEDGDKEACQNMGKGVNMQDYLPEYIVDSLPNKDRTFPPPCKEAGITSMKECAKFLGRDGDDVEVYEFMQQCEQENSREECMKRASEKFADRFGENERKFALPPPCMEAKITSPDECMKLMKEKGNGFTEYNEQKGEYGDDDEETFKEKYQGQPARIQEFGRDCHAVKELSEKVSCFESFYNDARGQFAQDFERRYEYKEELDSNQRMDQKYAEKWSSASEEDRKRMREEYESKMGDEQTKYRDDARYESREESKYEYHDDSARYEYKDETGEIKYEYQPEDSTRYEEKSPESESGDYGSGSDSGSSTGGDYSEESKSDGSSDSGSSERTG